MAWNAPITWVANTVLTAAQLNAQLRDNISETAPAKASVAGSHFVTTGANAIAERRIVTATVATAQALDHTQPATYRSLTTPGPSVTLTTGANALVWVNALASNSAADIRQWVSFRVTGATPSTTYPADDSRGISFVTAANVGVRAGICVHLTSLTAGTNSFEMLYKNTSSTLGQNGTFSNRTIVVMGL